MGLAEWFAKKGKWFGNKTNGALRHLEIVIFNAAGQLIEKHLTADKLYEINLGRLFAGMYSIFIQDKERIENMTKTIIKL